MIKVMIGPLSLLNRIQFLVYFRFSDALSFYPMRTFDEILQGMKWFLTKGDFQEPLGSGKAVSNLHSPKRIARQRGDESR